MKVKYKNSSIYSGYVDFPFREGDYVTIVVHFWGVKEDEDDVFYHGYITELDEERDGFWARVDDKPDHNELFRYRDIEAVFEGDKIPYLAGWTKRVDT